MNIITGYISPTSGTVSIEGYDITNEPYEAKKQIGYLPEIPPLYDELTTREFLKFICNVKGIDKSKSSARIDEVAGMLDISDVISRLLKNLSRGYRQRVGIAQALLGDPPVLILDEPAVGLDPQQIIEIRSLIKELGKDRIILLSSHILSEVNSICTRLLIINKGKIVAKGTAEELSRKFLGQDRLLLRVRGTEEKVMECVRAVAGVAAVTQIASSEPGTVEIVIEVDENVDVRDNLCSAICKEGFTIRLMRPEESSLEQIFLQLTTGRAGEGM